MPFGATALGAEQNNYQQACKTFGGSYEESKKGCDPDCVITYACRFADGTGRVCDDKGKCSPLGSWEGGQSSGDGCTDECSEKCANRHGRKKNKCILKCERSCNSG